ncbi:MAG TPA: hypothetical protein VF628_09870 [Allosphingosinicella sp.]|jgi:hypothetical protein
MTAPDPLRARAGGTTWRFWFDGPIDCDLEYVLAGESVRLHGRVARTSSAVATAYVILRIANS